MRSSVNSIAVLALAFALVGCAGARSAQKRQMAEDKLAAATFEVRAATSEDVWRYAKPLLQNAQASLKRAEELQADGKYDLAARWARSASAGARKATAYAREVKAREAAAEAKRQAAETKAFREGKPPPKPTAPRSAPEQGP